MNSGIFWDSAQSVSGAMLRVFFIIFLAGYLVRKKIINSEQISALSKVTVFVLLPSLIFSNNLISFHPNEHPYWWIIPLISVILSLLGLGIAFVLFLPDWRDKLNMLPVSSLQNAGYLVLPIVQILYPEKFQVMALYIFLFILGYNPLLWSLGKVLTTSSSEGTTNLQIADFINPPLISNILAIIIVLLSLKRYIPNFIIDSTHLLGNAAVPVATFVLGATLGGISLKKWPPFVDIIRVVSVKFIFIPGIAVFILYHWAIYKSHPLLSDFLIIEASAAPATAIILQVRTYGGNIQKIGGMMLISYIICLFAMPFWMAFWKSLIM